ncbi:cysteine--tRNA ligase [Candidatus Pacearchaeota archaeon]|nr:cysteine--tRNA ligase [Candidatus Pacearchaeota archaeon]
MKLYNTLTRNKEEFKPIGKEVGIYSCGPTVYNFPHVGNLRAFLFADLLKRCLLFKGFKIKHVMNVTDIDDKLIKKSEGDKEKLKEITIKYERAFKKNLEELNIIPADFYPRATESIKEMVEIVKKLLERGYAYKTSDGIYYSVKKFKDYGKLAGINLDNLKEGARVNNDEYDKESAKDFALWKFWQEEDGNIFWETEIGKGRPGWHIECSAMSSKYLGEHFDIHTGGIDLLFPHHTNELAQSEAANGKKFVNYWLHNEHLMINGEKMSKSLGNFYVLSDLVNKGFSLNAIRYLLISTHYRQKLNLTDETLKASEEAVKRILEFIANAKNREDNEKIISLIKETKKAIEKAIDDDLNIALVLSSIFKFIREANKLGAGKKAYELVIKTNEILGLSLEKEKIEIPEEVSQLVEEREKARKNKDWKKSDDLREEIKKLGFILDDAKDGVRVRKI